MSNTEELVGVIEGLNEQVDELTEQLGKATRQLNKLSDEILFLKGKIEKIRTVTAYALSYNLQHPSAIADSLETVIDICK